MRGVLIFVLGLAACGGTRYRTELVGHGNGVVSSRVGSPSPSTTGIAVARGNYEVAMRFDVPRAQVIDWRVSCPGIDVQGQAGEPLEQYRARRIGAAVRIGGVEIHANLADPTDVGAGSFVATAHVVTGADGVCTLQAFADDTNVRAAFSITRIRDLDAEERMRTIARREVAVKARGQLSTQLVTAGAKPQAHEPRVTADVRARAEARALYARQEYLAFLAGKCDARSHRTEELRESEARLDADAARAQLRDEAALYARASIQAQLVALGAKARPAMPPPKLEEPGPPPSEGAEWVAGYWSWESGAWAWEAGSWHEPDEPSMIWEASAGVYNERAEDNTRSSITPGVRDHRRARDRDHRDSSSSWEPPATASRDDDKPVVRDHRADNRGDWTPVSRGEDKKDDDDRPIVRDHRR